MAIKSDAGVALKTFIAGLGVTKRLTIDGSTEHHSPVIEFMKNCQRKDIQLKRTEPERPNYNPAEWIIR